jgi:chemotaxis signal transduction protein
MIATQAQVASPAVGARPIEVLVVRLQEANTRHSFGLLVRQVAALIRPQNTTVRPVAQPGPGRAVAEALYEDHWLPVYDLAEVLGLLAPWKMGRATTTRSYLLVIQDPHGQQVLLGVDDVTEIGVCRLDRIQPLPAWLRRQLHPPLTWGGVGQSDLAMVQNATDAAENSPAGRDAGLLLLLDCTPLVATGVRN